MIDYRKDAENWGNALNSVGWDVLDVWEDIFGEKMTVSQFNNIKSLNRFVILKYMEHVEKNLDKTA